MRFTISVWSKAPKYFAFIYLDGARVHITRFYKSKRGAISAAQRWVQKVKEQTVVDVYEHEMRS